MTRRFARLGAGAAALLALAACSPTTYDSSVATTEGPATSTTALPKGSARDILPVMLQEVEGLSAKVSAGKGDGEAATTIEELWAEIRDEVKATHPDALEDFDFVVRLCRSAADRNRPADADRAYRNLQQLVTAYLA